MNAITTIETNAVATAPRNLPVDLSPKTFEQAIAFSQYLADSELVPKDYRNKPANCLIAVQWGAEIGLKPLQAIQNIAVINGRPAIWGDAVIAVVRGSSACEYVIETQTATEATCRVKRRGEPEQVRTFSMDDAKRAGLIGKQGPWSQYPRRMMQMRARAFALRDVFPDVLRGLPVAEEAMDIPADAPTHAHHATDGHNVSNGGGKRNVLLETATQAAQQGIASYQRFWAGSSKEARHSLRTEHERLKAMAAQADMERTVNAPETAIDAQTVVVDTEAPPAAQGRPKRSFEDVLESLCQAKTLEALYAAAAHIDDVNDADSVATLNAKYDERLEELKKDEYATA